MEKSELRKQLLKRLLSLTDSEIKRRSKDVEDNLSTLSIYKQAKTIMAYYPLRGEVDILELINKDCRDKRFCFPVMDLKKKNLRIFETASLEDDFVRGPYGVKEPNTNKTKEVDVLDLDLVLVPGLGFDRKRNRLGRGAVFYDRFLPRLRPLTKKVGLAFELQILDDLPVNLSLDQKVETIVSENFII